MTRRAPGPTRPVSNSFEIICTYPKLCPFLASNVYTAIVDTQQLVHHGLVRPLAKERRDGVIAPVENEEQGCWSGRTAEIKQVAIRWVLHGRADFCGQPAASRRHALPPDHWALLQTQQDGHDGAQVVVEDGRRHIVGAG